MEKARRIPIFRATQCAYCFAGVNLMLLNAMVAYDGNVVHSGIGIGAALAVVCSWQRNRSILLAVIAGVLSWIYVLYFALTRKPEERKAA